MRIIFGSRSTVDIYSEIKELLIFLRWSFIPRLFAEWNAFIVIKTQRINRGINLFKMLSNNFIVPKFDIEVTNITNIDAIRKIRNIFIKAYSVFTREYIRRLFLERNYQATSSTTDTFLKEIAATIWLEIEKQMYRKESRSKWLVVQSP